MKRLLPLILLLSALSAAAQSFVGAGVSLEAMDEVTLLDADCSSTTPPALFGCGAGNDGLPFGARGELDRGLGFELFLGREFGRTRAAVVFASRSGFGLDALANFTGVSGEQPVTAEVESRSLMLTGAIDLGPQSWRLRPFITGGAGYARNEMGEVTFAFPGIAADAVTITSGGESTGFAWSGGVGVVMELASGFSIELSARQTDLGQIRGDRGEAVIIRPNRTVRLEIDAIEAELETRGVSVAVRQRF